jgi:hypothetical protein
MKYWILFGSGLFRLPFLAVEKRYGRRQGETYGENKYYLEVNT